MSKGKKDIFLPVFFGVLGVATLGLGYLGFSASSDADEAEAGYNKKLEELERLENAKLSRTEANAQEKEQRVESYVAKVKQLDTAMQAYQAPEKDITGDAFQRELKKAVDDFTAAAKAKGITIPEKFDFGMGKYLSTMAADAAPTLNAQLQGLVFLAHSTLEAGLLEVNSLSRQELPIETAPPEPKPEGTDPKKKTAPKPASRTTAKPGDRKAAKDAAPVVDESSVLQRQPVSMEVTGKNASILKFLELISNTSPDKNPYFFVIKTLKLENEKKDAPPKSIEVQVTEKADPNNKDAPPKKFDAEYLLGDEKVKLLLEMDLMRFVPGEDGEKGKATGNTGNKDATAKPDDKKAAGTSTPADTEEKKSPDASAPATKPDENKSADTSAPAPAPAPPAPAPASAPAPANN